MGWNHQLGRVFIHFWIFLRYIWTDRANVWTSLADLKERLPSSYWETGWCPFSGEKKDKDPAASTNSTEFKVCSCDLFFCWKGSIWIYNVCKYVIYKSKYNQIYIYKSILRTWNNYRSTGPSMSSRITSWVSWVPWVSFTLSFRGLWMVMIWPDGMMGEEMCQFFGVFLARQNLKDFSIGFEDGKVRFLKRDTPRWRLTGIFDIAKAGCQMMMFQSFYLECCPFGVDLPIPLTMLDTNTRINTILMIMILYYLNIQNPPKGLKFGHQQTTKRRSFWAEIWHPWIGGSR